MFYECYTISMSFSNGFFSTHKRTILGLVFGLAFSATLAYAVPPATKYTPAETLDPACIPGSSNCTVDISGTGAAWGLITGTLSDQTDLQDALDDKFDNPTGTTSQYIRGNGSLATFPALENPLTFSNGLTRTSDNVTNNLSTGVSGGQSVIGGTGASENLRLRSTADTTTGLIFFGAGSSTVFQESSNRFGIGTATPQTTIHIESPIAFSTQPIRVSEGSITYFQVNKVANNALGLGVNSGLNATNAINSTFIGRAAANGATNAANSIFIGTNAGATDTVNNTVSGTSILIGDDTSTGGFSSSIAIGKNATNTASNQFTIGSTYTQINARGVNYTWPSTQAAGSGYVLSNNGSGVLSWAAVGGGGGSITLQTDGVANGSQALLNLVGGSNVSLTDNGSGTVTIDASGGGSGVTSVDVSGAGPISFTGGPITSSGTISMSFGGTSADVVLADGSVAPYINIYNSDGTISGTRTISYSNDLSFTDTSTTKTGLSFDTTNFISRLGGSGGGVTTLEVDANNTRFAFLDGSLYIPTGASNGYVLTSDGSGNAAWAQSQADGSQQSSFFSAALGAGNGATTASKSVFLGNNAGLNDTVDNTGSANDFSILIGNNTSTGGFENSIAMGQAATNTASNQMMLGSTTRRIDNLVFNGGTGNTCSVNAGTGITCSSDERLKTNIADLETNTLEKVLSLRTVRYNWTSNPNGNQMIGFIAQNLKPQFPELITTNIDGMLSVNYAQMTPILVEALREMDLKITGIADLDTSNSWRDSLVTWFGSVTNGISKLFAGEITTKTLCVADESGAKTCLTKGQLDALIGNSSQSFGPVTQTPDPNPETPTPTQPEQSDESTDSEPTEPDPSPTPTPEVVTPEPTPAPSAETPVE